MEMDDCICWGLGGGGRWGGGGGTPCSCDHLWGDIGYISQSESSLSIMPMQLRGPSPSSHSEQIYLQPQTRMKCVIVREREGLPIHVWQIIFRGPFQQAFLECSWQHICHCHGHPPIKRLNLRAYWIALVWRDCCPETTDWSFVFVCGQKPSRIKCFTIILLIQLPSSNWPLPIWKDTRLKLCG